MDDARQQSTNTGKFSQALFFIISITSILLITIILSIIIEWLGIIIEWLGIAFDWWHLEKHYHAKHLFDSEINWVLGDFLSDNSFYKDSFLHIFEQSYYWTIKQTGLEWLSNHADYLVQYILAAIYIIQVVVVRLMVIVCAIPAFIVLNQGYFYKTMNNRL
jgi:hypothetical protein